MVQNYKKVLQAYAALVAKDENLPLLEAGAYAAEESLGIVHGERYSKDAILSLKEIWGQIHLIILHQKAAFKIDEDQYAYNPEEMINTYFGGHNGRKHNIKYHNFFSRDEALDIAKSLGVLENG